MKLQRLQGILLAGMICALQVVASPRVAGQVMFSAIQPAATVPFTSISGAPQQAQRMSFTASLPGGIFRPNRTFVAPGGRLAVSLDSPGPVFRLPHRLDLPWRTESQRYFSYPAIVEMESSFQTVDTPFVSEVRLSLGAVWKGRVRIDWFTESRALDSMMLGPPVAGMVNGARLAGAGLLEFEDDVYGVQMVFRIRRWAANPEERNAVRGLHRVYRTGRGFFLR